MLKKWVLKAIVQKTISFLPYSQQLNYLLQKYVTKGVHLSDDYFSDRLLHAKEHIAAYQQQAGSIGGKTTLELGTGWYPVVPIALFLSGADRIYTTDISRLSHAGHLTTTIRQFLEYAGSGQLENYVQALPERLALLREIAATADQLSFETMLKKLKMHYLVQDARQLSLPDASVDLVHSNNTFEHVYPVILKALLFEFKRIAVSGGVLSHFIDMSDHFAHFDRTITIYNYLRFSDRAWVWIDNSIQPQNRFRLSEYRKLYAELGIPITDLSFRPGDLEVLGSVGLHRKYRTYDQSDLAVSHCLVVSRV